MRLEIYRQNNLIGRITRTLGEISFDNELMYVPSITITLPIEQLSMFNGNEEVKLFINNKCFYGIVVDTDPDYEAYTFELKINHIIHEWTFRQINMNNAVKDKNLNMVYLNNAQYYVNNEELNEAIVANDFEVPPTIIINDDEIIKLSKAKAWNTKTGDTIKLIITKTPITEKDEKGNENITGYDIKISTPNNTEVKIKCTINKESPEPIDEEDYYEYNIVDQLQDIYKNINFVYGNWRMNFLDGSQNTIINYVYSRQNKLEALNQTIENTSDLWWRVNLKNEKVIDIGKFGEIKDYIISTKPSGPNNIRIINEPKIDMQYENVMNVALVHSDKADGGMSSLTLREVYDRPELQNDMFPVIYRDDISNNERDYKKYINQYPKFGSNNNYEYAVIDAESVALEDGLLKEGTFAFNDLYSFTTDNENNTKTKEITDKDRINAAKIVYERGIKRLINARRSFKIDVTTEELPSDINIGDRIRFKYSAKLYDTLVDGSYIKELCLYDDYFYITHISYNIDKNGVETNDLTLEKYLKIDREINGD